jgi:photosystem II stability/assembly factor-like uncharacterized protein
MRKITAVLLLWHVCAFAQKKTEIKDVNKLNFDAGTVSALSFRMVGPALTSGRVADIAVHPTNKDLWYIAAASGGVWITKNHGITFQPIFDGYGSYSIGCVELSPSNPTTVWVGSGENNNQRSVSYGDGVYKSVDGGKSFTNMGLKQSEHIGSIVIHPTNENVLWVAAYGPLWSKGGERGVYKSVDGGKTWKRTLFVSDDTGIAEVVIDPSNSEILYASAHQRRRHEWTYIGGGPESTLYKSTDGGETWREIAAGLPKSDMGRIGLAVSPADPNWVYAIVEGRYDKGGVYLSTNKGESWAKQGGFSTSGNYYQEIFCDPLNKRKVFAMDTYLHHTEDAGVTFKPTGESHKHVDNHVIWIDPSNTDHWLVGCDGGVYETYSHAKEWRFFDNLPITQFYKVTTDNDYPFYNIYGGTQDNNSMGGPSGTTNVSGILNTDWFITNGGDGFESATDWSNPNITYAQAQYGWLVRYDKQSGEKVPIQPMPAKGQPGYRWNWDAPLLVSKHDASTLYFSANKVFKSTNKGDDWTEISPDLSRQLDRNKVPVMGQVWSIDAVMKNASTTVYGNVVALDESPIKKGVLYAGTDDGLIQVSQNEGKDWKKIDAIPGVPAQTRVNMLTASRFNDQVVYAAFNNQRNGDFKPYLFKSADRGTTWTSISSNLPDRGTVYCIKQDFKTPNLLFVGTEFGAYFTTDEGQHWTKLSGLPTIAVYDLEIQERECDLVAATFGRGFYVLDNYSPLRGLTTEVLNKKAHLFDTENALLYVPADPLGLEGTGFQGHNMWASENPSFGAVFNFYMKDDIQSLKSKRQEKEKALEKDKKDVSYPTMIELRAEIQETKATCVWAISNEAGKEIKRFTTTPAKGISRVTWNLRSNPTTTVNGGNNGFLVPAGKYSLDVYLVSNKGIDTLVNQHEFNVKALGNQTLIAKNPEELNAFRKEVAEVSRKVSGIGEIIQEFVTQLGLVETALLNYPNTDVRLLKEVKALSLGLDSCKLIMYGDELLTKHEFESAPSMTGRLGMVEYMLYDNTTGVTNTHRSNLAAVNEEFTGVSARIKQMLTTFYGIEEQLALVPIPYTKSRGLLWKEE